MNTLNFGPIFDFDPEEVETGILKTLKNVLHTFASSNRSPHR